MRTIRYLFLAALGVALATVAFANRDMVTLHLLPAEISGFLGYSWQVSLPLFIVIFLGIVAGLMIGFVWEWMRESKHRSKARRAEKAAVRLSHEVKSLKRGGAGSGDDVLALLDDGR
ncbi:MAG: LapA family protein [Paracoccaceae bacterium]